MKRFLISISFCLLSVSLGVDSGVTLAQSKKNIHQAAVDGDVDQVKSLLANGTDVNSKNRTLGYTPLHSAAQNGQKAVVELLLEKGADINIKNKSGKTPLQLAAEYNKKEIVELLLAKGADVNAATGRGDNALSLARNKGNTEIVELLVAKGATEPVPPDMTGDGYYERESMMPTGPGRAAPAGRLRGAAAAPAVEVDLLADPNEIQARIKTFDGLEQAIVGLAKKSTTEMKYWAPSRTDNRSSVARAVHKQVEDELALVKKIAVEEKASKTVAAIDELVKAKKARYLKVSRELMAQRREAMQADSSRITGGRSGGRSSGRTSGRTSGRSSRGRYSSGSQAYGGANGGAYDGGGAYGSGGAEMGRSGRPGRPADQLDQATQDEITKWSQATPDKKPDLAKAVYPQIHTEIAMIRRVAVEEKAKKTTAAIDGILLSRQVRLDVFIKMSEALKQAVPPGQDPRTAGRYGDQTGRTSGRRGRTTRGGTTGTQQQGGRTRRR